MNWFKTGNAAKEAATKEMNRQNEARRAFNEGGPSKFGMFWFRLPVDTKTTITFLDGPEHPAGFQTPFVFKDHHLKIDGKWGHHFTCLAVEGENGVVGHCPLCEAGDKPSVVAAYTIIDHTYWKKGDTEHKDELKLFVCKMGVQDKLMNQMVKRGTLRGKKYEVRRGNDSQSANTGEDFDYEGEVDLAQFNNPQPADYFKEFAPKTMEELYKAIHGAAASTAAQTHKEVTAKGKDIKW